MQALPFPSLGPGTCLHTTYVRGFAAATTTTTTTIPFRLSRNNQIADSHTNTCLDLGHPTAFKQAKSEPKQNLECKETEKRHKSFHRMRMQLRTYIPLRFNRSAAKERPGRERRSRKKEEENKIGFG